MFVIPNGWNPTDLPMFEVKERHTPTRFVWRGGSTHFADLHTIKAEINLNVSPEQHDAGTQ